MAPTLKDIALQTGYAVSTISNVLNDNKSCFASAETRKAIWNTVHRLGYRPNYFARGLRCKRSFLVGIVASLFGAEITGLQMQPFADCLKEKGFFSLFGDSQGDVRREEQILAELRHNQVDGLIMKTFSGATDIERIVPPEIPCVLITRDGIPGFSCLVIDLGAAVQRAVRRLIELGHTRIVFLGTLSSNPTKLDGYRRAMRTEDILDDSLVVDTEFAPGSTRELILEKASFFRSITAIIASNDRIAIEVMSGLAEIGRQVPQDCSVVGFDDVNVAAVVRPTLTTLRQPREEAAQRAVEMLADRLAGKELESVVLVPQLVERDSTAPYRKKA